MRQGSALLFGLALGLCACGASEPDFSQPFLGNWYGYATETDLAADGSTNSSGGGVEVVLDPIGQKNMLRFSDFCASAEAGPTVTVNSATQLTFQPYTCAPVTASCTVTVSLSGGSGTVQGDTLSVGLDGTLRQEATGGCAAGSASFHIEVSLTRDPANALPPPELPTNIQLHRGDFYGSYYFTWANPDPTSTLQLQVSVWNGAWQDLTLNDDASLTFNQPEQTPLGLRLRAVKGARSTPYQSFSFNSGLYAPALLATLVDAGVVTLVWTPRPDVDAMLIDRAEYVPSATPSWTRLASVPPTPGSYSDLSVDAGTTYLYQLHWVAGVVDGWNSPAQLATP